MKFKFPKHLELYQRPGQHTTLVGLSDTHELMEWQPDEYYAENAVRAKNVQWTVRVEWKASQNRGPLLFTISMETSLHPLDYRSNIEAGELVDAIALYTFRSDGRLMLHTSLVHPRFAAEEAH